MRSVLDTERLVVFGERNKDGARKRVGRVVEIVFDPAESRVMGLLVERPNILFLIRRKEVILALDRARVLADRVEVDGGKAWGKQAAKRLGVDWDKAVIWKGMPVRTESGTRLGDVRDAVFDEHDGHLNGLGLTEGFTRDAAVGVRDVPATLVRGWNGTAVIVADEARRIGTEGGAAAAAGRGAAVAQDAAVKSAAAVGAAAQTTARYAKSAAKVAVKSETAKKTMSFLKSVKDQIVDAAGPPDDDE